MSVPECVFYVGIDWAAETHAVCVLNAAGRIKTQFTIEHTAAGFADLLRRLGRLTDDPARCAGRDRTTRRPAGRRAARGRATRSCRSARTRSRPGATARCCPARSPTPATPR